MEMTRKTVSELFPVLRERHGKTLDQISERTGIAKSTLIKLEKGRIENPQAKTVYRLNKYFSSIG